MLVTCVTIIYTCMGPCSCMCAHYHSSSEIQSSSVKRLQQHGSTVLVHLSLLIHSPLCGTAFNLVDRKNILKWNTDTITWCFLNFLKACNCPHLPYCCPPWLNFDIDQDIFLWDDLIFRRLLLLYVSPHQYTRVGQGVKQRIKLAVPEKTNITKYGSHTLMYIAYI